MAATEFVEGDSGSVLRVTCKNNSDKVVIDLTGKSVKLRFQIDSGTVAEKAMTVVLPATGGKADYQFLTSELVAGVMRAAAEITEGSSIIRQLDPFLMQVRAKL